MPQQSEEAATKFVVPHLDLVIVATGHNQRLHLVEVNAADRAIVLVEALEKNTHAAVKGERERERAYMTQLYDPGDVENVLVPKLDDAIVERREDPWSQRVKAQPYESAVHLC